MKNNNHLKCRNYAAWDITSQVGVNNSGYIQECDNILIASPLYFSELTGKLLDVGSRLQTYFCARFFRNEEPIVKSKK